MEGVKRENQLSMLLSAYDSNVGAPEVKATLVRVAFFSRLHFSPGGGLVGQD